MNRMELKILKLVSGLNEPSPLLFKKLSDHIKSSDRFSLQLRMPFNEHSVSALVDYYHSLSAGLRSYEKRKENKHVVLQFKLELFEQKVTIEYITMIVSGYYNTDVSTIRGRSRKVKDLLPRFVVCYFSTYKTGACLKEIGDYLGGRDHSTIINAKNRILEKESAKDPLNRQIWRQVEEIEAMLPKKNKQV